MSGTKSSQFFWSDWISDPALKQCSFAARGLWMDILCICATSDPYGYVAVNGIAIDTAGIATQTGKPIDEVVPLLAELERWRVFSRDDAGCIFNRRMVRDAAKAEAGRLAAQKRWRPQPQSEPTEEHAPNGSPIGSPGKNPSPSPLPKKRTPHRPPGGGREGEDLFDRLWTAYPKRDGANPRKPARDRFRAACKSGADPEAIIAGAVSYRRHCEARGKVDTPYVAQAATWLNQQRWLDDYGDPSVKANGRLSPEDAELLRKHQVTPDELAKIRSGQI